MARSRIRAAVVAGSLLALGMGLAPADAGAPQLGRFIVVLDDNVSAPAVLAEHAARLGVRVQGAQVWEHALHGYAADLPLAAVAALLGDSRVQSVEANVATHIDASQPGAPWGLDRTDQHNLPLNQTFNYTRNGTGVTAYMLDTGIKYSHVDFGGRATPGFDAITPGGNSADCNGHGTHTAGTVGGSTFGIAKNVHLVAVRVLDCQGSGNAATTITALDWVVSVHNAGQPAVANMSLSTGGKVAALNQAVRRLINDGVMVVMSAGNGNDFGAGKDACKISPASTKEGLTVAATDRTDTRPGWSNFGPCVDLFAPGVEINSADSAGDTGGRLESGTSMSAPHVAGVVAQYLQSNPTATGPQVHTAIVNLTTKGIVQRPNGGLFNNIKSPNRLLFTNL